eukprot:g1246.t1
MNTDWGYYGAQRKKNSAGEWEIFIVEGGVGQWKTSSMGEIQRSESPWVPINWHEATRKCKYVGNQTCLENQFVNVGSESAVEGVAIMKASWGEGEATLYNCKKRKKVQN